METGNKKIGREDKLKQALRKNLHKRKSQARASQAEGFRKRAFSPKLSAEQKPETNEDG